MASAWLSFVLLPPVRRLRGFIRDQVAVIVRLPKEVRQPEQLRLTKRQEKLIS